MVYEDMTDEEYIEEVDDAPCSMRVLPLPRRWELTPQESRELHEAFLLMLARELELFLAISRVRQAYNAYLQYGGWIQHAPAQHEAAGSDPFDTHDFERFIGRHRKAGDDTDD
jgi:hypothetical protein